eukprot:m.9315 g.9315  ORF g.9315 m.9315 type:complete len:297 (-) comp4704_c0_seq1:837-1727(-)
MASQFRHHYYQKIGFEAVLPLEDAIDLSADVIDTPFIVRYILWGGELTTHDRATVWKYLLGTTPECREAREFVRLQLTEHFDDLRRVVALLQPEHYGTDATFKTEELFTAMYSLCEYEQTVRPRSAEEVKLHLSVASVMLAMCPVELDAFWLTAELLQRMDSSCQPPVVIRNTLTLLLAEDPKLSGHLAALAINEKCDVLIRWVRLIFADHLPTSILLRVWDRIAAGAPHFLSFFCLSILLSIRMEILRVYERNSLLASLAELSWLQAERRATKVLDKAIQLWREGRLQSKLLTST